MVSSIVGIFTVHYCTLYYGFCLKTISLLIALDTHMTLSWIVYYNIQRSAWCLGEPLVPRKQRDLAHCPLPMSITYTQLTQILDSPPYNVKFSMQLVSKQDKPMIE